MLDNGQPSNAYKFFTFISNIIDIKLLL